MQKHRIFIGIDISKLKIDAYALGGKPCGAPHAVFENSAAGFADMQAWAKGKGPLRQTFFCMEHTGIYALPLCGYLARNGHTYAVVPALEIKRSLGVQRGKSDKADARAIARYIALFHREARQHTLPAEAMDRLKLLLSQRDRLIKAQILLTVPVREMGGFVDGGLTESIRQQSGEAAALLGKQVKECDTQMLAIVKADTELHRLYKLLVSVPGIGPQTALHMLVATRCFTRFGNGRKFACYCGIAPFDHSSGSSIKGRTRVSHLADKKMKTLLSMGARSSIQHDPQTRLYYQKKEREGKHDHSILNAVRNKIVLRAFAAVKRGTPFVKLHQHAA
jgi:transposase